MKTQPDSDDYYMSPPSWAYVRQVVSGGFFRGVMTLMSGTALAKGLTIAAAPILTRLYEPSAFGILGLFIAVIGTVSVVAAWRYELAIVIPRSDDDAANVLALSCMAVLLTSAASLVGVHLLGKQLATWLGSPELARWLLWAPLAIALMGLYQIFSYWSTRREHFGRLAMAQTLHSTTMVSTQIVAGLNHLAAAGLIAGQVAGKLVATGLLAVKIWRQERSLFYTTINTTAIRQVSRDHSNFPHYSAPQALINAFSRHLPIFILAFYFNPAIVGYYALAHRVLKLPILLIGDAVRQAFYPQGAKLFHEGRLAIFLARTTIGLTLLCLPLALALVFLGPQVFAWALGENWIRSGIYAQVMGFWLLSSVVMAPSLMAIHILGLQKLHAIAESVVLLLRAAALVIGGLLASDLLAIILYSAVGLAMNTFLIGSAILGSSRKRTPDVQGET